VAGSIGWAVRDRATRQAAIEVEVDLALEEIAPARNAGPRHLTNGVNRVCSKNVLNAELRWYEHDWRRGRSTEGSIRKR
jgi:hypothetical protein